MCLEFGMKLPQTLSLCWLCFWWFCQPPNRPQRTQSQSTAASHSWHNISFNSIATIYPNCILHGLQPSIYPPVIPQLKWYLVLSMFPAIVCPVNPFNDEANGLSSHSENPASVHCSHLPGSTHTQGGAFPLAVLQLKKCSGEVASINLCQREYYNGILPPSTAWR